MDTPSSQPLFRMPVDLRWRDLDAFNHVNNATFLTYVEEARIQWFESFDEAWVTEHAGPLVAAVQMNYRTPIPYPADVVVELYFERLGTSSATIGHRIVGGDGATLYADGHAVVVWVERASGRPIPLPAVLRRAAARPAPPPPSSP